MIKNVFRKNPISYGGSTVVLYVDGWIGWVWMGWISPGVIKYRAPYGAYSSSVKIAAELTFYFFYFCKNVQMNKVA